MIQDTLSRADDDTGAPLAFPGRSGKLGKELRPLVSELSEEARTVITPLFLGLIQILSPRATHIGPL